MIPFTFYFDWVMCAQFAGLCWAQATELYRAAGLDVTLVPWHEDSRGIVEKVMTATDQGTICAGSSEDNLIVSACAAGVPIKALATMLQDSPLVLITKTTSGIRTLADLPGRRVAMQPDGNRILEAVLALVMSSALTFMPYAISASLYVFMVIFTHTFLFGLLSRLDQSGRAVAATPAMMMVGSCIGPALGGAIVQGLGYQGLGWAACIVTFIAVIGMIQVRRSLSVAATQSIIKTAPA